jgi:RNA polymerase sigma-70 factor (ECF subfamily)
VRGETAIGQGGRTFPTTRWTRILEARESEESRRAALAELVTTYWKPLYFYLRRKGEDRERAKDTVQGFFAHLLERDFLARLAKEKGSFRAYLRMALDHYRANVREAESAAKRGGGARTVSLDFDVAENELRGAAEDPLAAYDRAWAVAVMERALAKLETELAKGTRTGSFDAVRRFFGSGEPPSYAEASAACGMSVPRFKAFLHRARERFRRLVREEVGHTVDGAADGEISGLLDALR